MTETRYKYIKCGFHEKLKLNQHVQFGILSSFSRIDPDEKYGAFVFLNAFFFLHYPIDRSVLNKNVAGNFNPF